MTRDATIIHRTAESKINRRTKETTITEDLLLT